MTEFDCDEIMARGKRLCSSSFANRDQKVRVVVNECDNTEIFDTVTIFDDWF